MPDDLPLLTDDPHVLFQYVLEQQWRLRSLDHWRDGIDKRVGVLESQVVTEQQARALREALAKQGRLQLTRLQQAVLALAALAELANLIRGFTGHG